MRMGIRCFEIVRSKAYIFVQQYLRKGELKPLERKDAEKRAAIAEEFFKDVLNVDQVTIC